MCHPTKQQVKNNGWWTAECRPYISIFLQKLSAEGRLKMPFEF